MIQLMRGLQLPNSCMVRADCRVWEVYSQFPSRKRSRGARQVMSLEKLGMEKRGRPRIQTLLSLEEKWDMMCI